MIKFEFEGEVRNVPTNPKEVMCGQYEEFKYLYRQYLNSTEDQTAINMLACLVPVLGEWVSRLPYYDPKQGITDDGLVPTIQWLFWVFTEVCLYDDKDLSYKDLEDFTVEIESENYYLLGSSCRSLMFPQGQKLDVQEAIESEMVRKKMSELDAAELYRSCDLVFTFNTEIAAIMLRKEGEELPFRPAEYEAFITGRQAFFAKHLTMDAAKKLVFFLDAKQTHYTELMNLALISAVTEAQTQPNREQRRKQEQLNKKGKQGRIIPLNMPVGKVHISKA